MTHVFVETGRRLSRPGFSRHFVTAFVIALLAVSFVTEAQAAKPYPTGAGSQNGFVAACRANGGTTKRLESRVVQCTLPNGHVIVCNFNSGLCKDFPPTTIAGASTGTNSPGGATGSRARELQIGLARPQLIPLTM